MSEEYKPKKIKSIYNGNFFCTVVGGTMDSGNCGLGCVGCPGDKEMFPMPGLEQAKLLDIKKER